MRAASPAIVNVHPPLPVPADTLLRGVLGQLSTVVLWLDATGTVRFANDAFFEATGWTHDEVVGADWSDGLVPAGCAAWDLFRSALGGAGGRGEGELFTRYGERRRVVWDVVALSDAAGRPDGAVGVGRDVTEEGRVARDRERLERALAAQVDHDALTGLLNRRGFARATEHARRVAARTHRVDAVLTVRLGALGSAAAHGQAAVDDAVCAAAEAVRAVVRDSDLVARVADDLFAVYAVGTGAPDHGAAAAHRVRERLAAHDARALASGRTFDLGWSVGAAERGPGDDLDALLARALGAIAVSDAAAEDAPPTDAEAWCPDPWSPDGSRWTDAC